jgi:hypothetical protein
MRGFFLAHRGHWRVLGAVVRLSCSTSGGEETTMFRLTLGELACTIANIFMAGVLVEIARAATFFQTVPGLLHWPLF